MHGINIKLHVMYFQEEYLVLPCVLRTCQKMKFVHRDGTDITLCGCESTQDENDTEILHDMIFLILHFLWFLIFG
jgi:hypothetical protein